MADALEDVLGKAYTNNVVHGWSMQASTTDLVELLADPTVRDEAKTRLMGITDDLCKQSYVHRIERNALEYALNATELNNVTVTLPQGEGL